MIDENSNQDNLSFLFGAGNTAQIHQQIVQQVEYDMPTLNISLSPFLKKLGFKYQSKNLIKVLRQIFSLLEPCKAKICQFNVPKW